MKVCIVGCGAIGSLFAAHLARLKDVEVWAYEVNKAHVDAINAGGLRLSGFSQVHSHPKASSDASKIPPCDFGIVATKSQHTRAAMEATAQGYGESQPVAPNEVDGKDNPGGRQLNRRVEIFVRT